MAGTHIQVALGNLQSDGIGEDVMFPSNDSSPLAG